MKTLGTVQATPQQLTLIEDSSPGYWVISGAAGSGKTTTAVFRLKFLVSYWRERRLDLALDDPVRVLVLTFNRTLRGYIADLVEQQISDAPDVQVEVTTFAGWGQRFFGTMVLSHQVVEQQLSKLAGTTFPWSTRFLSSEVQYAIGRFLPAALDQYLTAERTGRGASPRVSRTAKQTLLDQVIRPYNDWKENQGVADWNDLAVFMAEQRRATPYDVVIVDETQDFSANQVRGVIKHLADDFVCTFIRDTTQRIYPNVFGWSEVGITVPQTQQKRLEVNYRNTQEIAQFARPLVVGLEAVDDANLPDFRGCVRSGPKPIVVRGRYSQQLEWAIERLRSGLIGPDETVAFLHPVGWFSDLRARLDAEGMGWTSLTREAEWPDGPEQIALSTMHSAKGLEFDHVILIGYNALVTPHGEEPGDSLLETHRRLLAMSIGRARHTVTIGYKPSEASDVLDVLDPATFDAIDL
jgi:superfamily I DNA/RNA helicase